MTLTYERLRKLFIYSQDNGCFIRRTGTGGRRAGSVAGTTGTSKQTGASYRYIHIDGKRYLAHRLAWLYVHGVWPKHEIDHIDNDGLNNRILNLREAKHAENTLNRGAPASNTSGYKGVSRNKRLKKWQAFITFEGRTKYLGLFTTPEAAHAAYCHAAADLHGEFARTK